MFNYNDDFFWSINLDNSSEGLANKMYLRRKTSNIIKYDLTYILINIHKSIFTQDKNPLISQIQFNINYTI